MQRQLEVTPEHSWMWKTKKKNIQEIEETVSKEIVILPTVLLCTIVWSPN